MKFEAILQISEFDKEWDFNPDWVTRGDRPHLLSLIRQIKGLEASIDVSVVTGKTTEDKRIKELAKVEDATIYELDESSYKNHKFKSITKNSTADFCSIFSGYTAVIDSELLNYVFNHQELANSLVVNSITWKRKNLPAILHKKTIKHSAEQQKINRSGKGNQPEDFPRIWHINPEVPYWIFPARLVAPARSNNDRDKIFQIPQDKHLTKKNELYFRNIISSDSESNLWTTIKQKQNEDLPNYITALNVFYKMAPRELNLPPAIQWEIPSNTNLIPGFKNYQQSIDQEKPPINTWEKIQRLDFSPLYQTYLQIGVYNDPLANPRFQDLLPQLEDERLRLGLHTRGLNLTKSHAEKLINFFAEIFCTFGGNENIYNDMFDDGSHKKCLENFKILKEAKKRHEVARVEEGGGGGDLPFLNIVAYPQPENLTEQYNWLADNWMNWEDFKQFFNQKYDKDWSEVPLKHRMKKFYEHDKTANYKIFKNIPTFCGNLENSLNENKNQFTPLNRKQCTKIEESLTIHADGKITCCFMGNSEELTIGSVESGIEEAWASQKRHKIIEGHRNKNYSITECCASCQEWYQPVL